MSLLDSDATPTNNPLLWWLVVLIQTEVMDNQPRWEVEGVQKTLDFSQKLEALDHYTRVLILDYAYHAWMNDHSSGGASQSDKEKITKYLDTVSLEWVAQDQERPQLSYIEEFKLSNSWEWIQCSSYIHPILAQWLTDRSRGPMSDIIKLRRRKLVLFKQQRRYCVKMEIHEDFTTDPRIADCYPAHVATKSTIEKANQAAQNALMDELGGKPDARIWHEVYEDDGRVRIRAVYKDSANNAKAIAWVEEELVDEPVIDAGNMAIRGNKRMREDEHEESEEDEEEEEEGRMRVSMTINLFPTIHLSTCSQRQIPEHVTHRWERGDGMIHLLPCQACRDGNCSRMEKINHISPNKCCTY